MLLLVTGRGRRLLFIARRLSDSRMLLLGAIVLVAFSAVYVTVNGVVLDESVMQAQVLSGDVQYPSDHPSNIYFRQAYNLPGYLVTIFMKAGLGVTELSLSRNIAFLFLSLFVPFALTILLTRSMLFGFLTIALVLTESAIYFGGAYPIHVFPDFYSLGHIGMQLSLLTAILLLGGYWRSGGGLLGILPLIHPTMAVVIWPWSVLSMLLGRTRFGKSQWLPFMLSFGIGALILITVLLLAYFIFGTANSELTPEQRQYAQTVYEGFTVNFDDHRMPFIPTTFAYLVNPIFFFLMGGLILWNLRNVSAYSSRPIWRMVTLLLILGASAWVYIYAARIALFYMDILPLVINISMPFRFSNITAVLLIPFTITAYFYSQKNMSETNRNISWVLLVGTVTGAGIFMLIDGNTEHVIVRMLGRLFHPRMHLFTVWGILLAGEVLASNGGIRNRLPVLISAGSIAILLIALFPREAQAFILSFVIGGLVYLAFNVKYKVRISVPHMLISWRAPSAIATVLLLSAVTTLHTGQRERGYIVDYVDGNSIKWNEVSSFDRRLRDWLSDNTEPNEMILPAICCVDSILSVKTGHPVLLDWDTVYSLSYMPDLAFPIGRLAYDLFEIDFTDAEQIRSWHNLWESRTAEDWQTLGARYDFRLILSLTDVPLNLPSRLAGPIWTLYVIPDRSSSPELDVADYGDNAGQRIFSQ